MRTTFVSEDKRSQILSLRKSGASWLKIESVTDVPRRTAKRIFEEWQQARSIEGIETARHEVAAESFKSHMQSLISLAQEICRATVIPELADHRSGRQVIDGIFDADIRGMQINNVFPSLTKKDIKTINRQNRILLDSLKHHTRETLDWSILEQWAEARQSWQSGMEELETVAAGLITGAMSFPRYAHIFPSYKNKEQVKQIAKGVAETAYYGLVSGKRAGASDLIIIRQLQKRYAVLFGGNVSVTELAVETDFLADGLSRICRDIIKMLFDGQDTGIVDSLYRSLDIMMSIHNDLEDKLDELRLTPIILKTRCDICPA